jgi:hypothetical protein
LFREYMKASLFYRIAAVLLLLFAAGHTLGFSGSEQESVRACAIGDFARL